MGSDNNQDTADPRILQLEDPVESLRSSRFREFVDSQPDPIKQHFIVKRHGENQNSELSNDPTKEDTTEEPKEDETTTIMFADSSVDCSWNIKTEPGLYLLATFHNLSAPFTVDCEGAYIEVERENNGFEARWCGNRVTQGGSRPHVIFARNEVRISVFDDGVEGKILPTGFNADVEVIDLFDAGQYTSLRRSNAYSRVRQISGRSLVR